MRVTSPWPGISRRATRDAGRGVGYYPARRCVTPDLLLGARAAEFREAEGTSSSRRTLGLLSCGAYTSASAGGRTWTPDTKAVIMTRNESFKRRIRERMAKTGEKYVAARRVLIEHAAARDSRSWAAQPEHTDAVIRENTGRDWDEWCDLIDAWPGHGEGHTAVAAWLQEEHGVDGWWAQAVTVGWERITGRRLPGQMADGTFTANKSATIATDHVALREMLLDDDGGAALFPGMDPELRSRPTSKNVRVGLGDGVAEIAIVPKGDGRVTVTVAHTKLSSSEDVAHWKAFWSDWLEVLDEGTPS